MLHAIRQGSARYGLSLVEIAEVKTVIAEGRSTLVEKQSNRVSVHDVKIGNRVVRAVYDRRRHEVVTFLPRPASSRDQCDQPPSGSSGGGMRSASPGSPATRTQ